MVKKLLLGIVVMARIGFLKYRVDAAAQRSGCIVLRLPPYRCEFSFIEPVWTQIKKGLADGRTTFEFVHVETLRKKETAKVTEEI